MRMTVHSVPRWGEGSTPCCGKTPFELPRGDQMTMSFGLVTCSIDPEQYIAGLVRVAKIQSLNHLTREVDRVREEVGLPSRTTEAMSRLTPMFAEISRTFGDIARSLMPQVRKDPDEYTLVR